MSIDHSDRRLRIPVRFVDGVWECDFGGAVPVKEGSHADLVVQRAAIKDKDFLAVMARRETHKVLEEGTVLIVAVTLKWGHPVPKHLMQLAKPWDWARDEIAKGYFDIWGAGDTYFVEVRLARPDPKQARRFKTDRGGLWLITQGVEAIGLASTTILLPEEIWPEPVASLNHAYTKLSETFETWRISHTGNIYRRVFYQESNGKWYPLDVLRNRALDKQDKEIARGLWAAFMAKMTSAASSRK